MVSWIEYKAEVYKELGFKERNEQERLIYLGSYEALVNLVNFINLLAKKKELDNNSET